MEQKGYKTLKRPAEASFVEKKSRFIGYCAPVKTEKEALAFVNSIREQHRTATHNVFAYSLREGNLCRYSDDGEPQGTAGLPVLDVLTRGGIVDAAIVVTRYFGGTLLGTGGLVRAYGEGASLAVAAAGVANMQPCAVYTFSCAYGDFDRVKNAMENLGINIVDTQYTDRVTLQVALRTHKTQQLMDTMRELSRGACVPVLLEERFEDVGEE